MTDGEPVIPQDNIIIPDTLDNAYDLLELIDERPGMCTMEVRRKSDGKRCVAKLFSGTMQANGRREADILGKLDHPHIPKLVEYIEDGGTCIMIREYVEGKPLDRYVAERVISEPVIIGIGMKICRVLEYLHGLPEPVIHRDIKPQNIIVDDKGEIHLIDFGISRIRNERSSVDTVFAGTVAYAPPEQYGFRQTDRRADIYSLGMVLQYMLTGSVDTTSDKSGTEGSRLGEIIRKCTSFAPEKRFGSIRELYKSLARLNRPPVPNALIAGLLAVCLLVGSVLGCFAGMALERGRTADTMSDQSGKGMPVTSLSTVLGLNDMTEEELLSITGIYIYGNTVFDTLYTKNAADPSGEKTEVNSFVSGHPYTMDYTSGPIEISDGTIDDISCLKNLKNLKQLVIIRNNIWDVTPLEGLTQLEFLDLSANPIADITALRSLSSLRQLYLSYCSISDLSPVYDLSSLEVLHASDNTIGSLRGISALRGLKVVNICCNGLTDVSELGEMNGLEQINVGDNRVTDVSFLLSHSGNKIADIEISSTAVTDTSPLCSGLLFDNSRSVRIAAENLGTVDLSFLRDIDTIHELRLGGTDCAQLSQYVQGKQILWLVANDSGLSDISWLENVTGIWNLEIAHNPGITDLSVLTGMNSLQVVTLSEDMRPLTKSIPDDVSFSFNFV